VPRGYEFFDHTADIGAAVRGPTLPRLFENASCALFGLTCDRRTVRPGRGVALQAAGSSLEDLLVRWLSELLHLQHSGGWVFSSCVVAGVDRSRLRARGRARGERFDPSRHRIRREVKAITYHRIRLTRLGGAWRVRIVFDV
jgi:protein archease